MTKRRQRLNLSNELNDDWLQKVQGGKLKKDELAAARLADKLHKERQKKRKK